MFNYSYLRLGVGDLGALLCAGLLDVLPRGHRAQVLQLLLLFF